MIIDIHAHTTNHKLRGLHTPTATIADLEKLAGRHDVEKIVLMATYFPFKGTGLANNILLERIQNNNLFAMFGSLDAMNNLDNGIAELKELARQRRIAGIKLYPGYQNFDPTNEKIFPLYDLAAYYHLPIMFHTGDLHHCCPRKKRQKDQYHCGNFCPLDRLSHLARPQTMVDVIEKFSPVNFILSHLSWPHCDQLLEIMKKHPNVYTDTSSLDSAEDSKIELQKFLAIDGLIERILFGTDFPIQSYKESIALIDGLNLSPAEKKKIFYQNAIKLLNHGGATNESLNHSRKYSDSD
jgi:hypothetical protein